MEKHERIRLNHTEFGNFNISVIDKPGQVVDIFISKDGWLTIDEASVISIEEAKRLYRSLRIAIEIAESLVKSQ